MRVLTENDEIRFRIKIRKLKRELEQARRKAASETQANKSLVNANTLLVDKDRYLMFEIKKLEEENKQYKHKIEKIINLIDKGYNVSLERIKSILIDNNENDIN